MLLRVIILFLWLLRLELSVSGQDSGLQRLADSLSNQSDHGAVINEVNRLLKERKWPVKDELILQGIVVTKLTELQRWDSCLNYCRQQVAKARQDKNLLAEATFYRLIGNTYYHIPEKEKAMQYWQKCIAISQPQQFDLLLEQSYHNLGAVILETGSDLNQAESYFRQAIRISEEHHRDTTVLGNQHYRLLASLYKVTKKYEEADRLFNTVIQRARKRNDSLQMAEALMFYATLLSEGKKSDKAIAAGKEALLISQKFNRLDMELTALELLSGIYSEAGNYREAYQLLYQLKSLALNRYNTDLNSKLSEAEVKLKNAELENEKEMALLNARKEKELLLIAAAGLLIILGISFYYFYQKKHLRQKARMQKEVQEEKERISRDLHDKLGSQMALLSNNIESLDTHFRKEEPIGPHIEKVKGNSRLLLQTLREAIWILDKEEVEAEDFFDKLVDHAQRYLQQTGGIRLETRADFPEKKILLSNEALQLFRICQEAISNACRYSGTKELLISGRVGQGRLMIIINDRGIGFDPEQTQGGDHYGIRNMRQRAEQISAQIKIESRPGEGTLVELTV